MTDVNLMITISMTILVFASGLFAGMSICEYKFYRKNKKMLKEIYESYRRHT